MHASVGGWDFSYLRSDIVHRFVAECVYVLRGGGGGGGGGGVDPHLSLLSFSLTDC